MKKMITKEQIIAGVQNLNAVIATANLDNCYEKILQFFRITSTLQDHSGEFERFLPPIEGIKFCGWRSTQRKKSETKRAQAEKALQRFISEISKSGRNLYGYNRTKPGENVTKDKIFFGNTGGIITLTVEEFEKCPNDVYVQEHIRNQIVDFMKSYKASFNTEWLQ